MPPKPTVLPLTSWSLSTWVQTDFRYLTPLCVYIGGSIEGGTEPVGYYTWGTPGDYVGLPSDTYYATSNEWDLSNVDADSYAIWLEWHQQPRIRFTEGVDDAFLVLRSGSTVLATLTKAETVGEGPEAVDWESARVDVTQYAAGVADFNVRFGFDPVEAVQAAVALDDIAGVSFVGFELGQLQQDPQDPYNPPTAWDMNRPFLFDGAYGSDWYSLPSEEWAHRNGDDTFGGSRSLRMGLGAFSLHQDGSTGPSNFTTVQIKCGAGSVEDWEIRVHWKATQFVGHGYMTIEFMSDNDALQGYLEIFSDGTTNLYDQTGLIDTGTAPITDGTDHLFQFFVRATSSGFVQFKVDGTLVVSQAGDFQSPFGSPGVGLGGWNLTLQGDVDIECLIYLDDFIAVPSGYLDENTDYYVLGARPVADHATDSTPSAGTDVYAVLDENVDPLLTVDTGDLTTLAAAGDEDLFQVTTLPACSVIAVAAHVACRSSDATTWDVDLAADLDGTTVYGATSEVSTPSTEDFRTLARGWHTAPDGASWTRAKFNSSRFGYRATTGTSDLQVAAFGVEVLVSEADDTQVSTGEGWYVDNVRIVVEGV